MTENRFAKAARVFWDSPAGQARREALRAKFKAQTKEQHAAARRKWWDRLTPKQQQRHLVKMRKGAVKAGAQSVAAKARWAQTSPEGKAAHMAKMVKASNAKPASEARLKALADARKRLTPERMAEIGRRGAATLNARLTPEEKSAIGRKGFAVGLGKMTRKQKQEAAHRSIAMRHFKRKGYIVEAKKGPADDNPTDGR